VAVTAVLRPRRTRPNYTPYLLLLPGLAWLVVFFVVPTLSLASQSLQTGNVETGYALTWHFQTYVDALSQFWPHFTRSIFFAGTATVLTLLLAYPLAYFIAQKVGRWKNFLLVLVIAPFFTSFLIRTLAWQTILTRQRPRGGSCPFDPLHRPVAMGAPHEQRLADELAVRGDLAV